jgi:DNA primase
MSEVNDVVRDLANTYLKWWKETSDHKNIQGACPFHQESTEGAFYMNLDNGLFICHSCRTSGNLFTFLKEVGAPSRKREAILDLVKDQLADRPKKKAEPRDFFKGLMPLNESILGVFDFCPTSLLDAGFEKKVLAAHDIGFDKDYQRITFPIRNHLGVLYGISGRTVTGDNPRYLFYKEVDLLRLSAHYRGYDFQKSQFLWNMHRVYSPAFHGDVDRIYIVEGFKAALWMIQNGAWNTVALMGTYLSAVQQRLLQRTACELVLFLDNTVDAQKGVFEAGERLRRSNHVAVCRYPRDQDDGAQPDDLPPETITEVINNPETFTTWRRKHVRRSRKS